MSTTTAAACSTGSAAAHSARRRRPFTTSGRPRRPYHTRTARDLTRALPASDRDGLPFPVLDPAPAIYRAELAAAAGLWTPRRLGGPTFNAQGVLIEPQAPPAA
jgi:hypothetical protein